LGVASAVETMWVEINATKTPISKYREGRRVNVVIL
jgi:hypothetical protein